MTRAMLILAVFAVNMNATFIKHDHEYVLATYESVKGYRPKIDLKQGPKPEREKFLWKTWKDKSLERARPAVCFLLGEVGDKKTLKRILREKKHNQDEIYNCIMAVTEMTFRGVPGAMEALEKFANGSATEKMGVVWSLGAMDSCPTRIILATLGTETGIVGSEAKLSLEAIKKVSPLVCP